MLQEQYFFNVVAVLFSAAHVYVASTTNVFVAKELADW